MERFKRLDGLFLLSGLDDSNHPDQVQRQYAMPPTDSHVCSPTLGQLCRDADSNGDSKRRKTTYAHPGSSSSTSEYHSSGPFDTMLARINASIGHPDMAAFRESFSAAQNETEIQEVVKPVTQPNGLMEFMRFDLGEVLQKENGTKKPRILRIVAGNPMIMKEMVKHIVDAGSYAPVTILIEERPDAQWPTHMSKSS